MHCRWPESGKLLRGLLLVLLISTSITSAPATAQPVVDAKPIVPQLPSPSRARSIGVTELRLEDARSDPWKPGARRELMISVWYPARAARGGYSPYMRPGAAKLFASM